jgi:hypothetical protein
MGAPKQRFPHHESNGSILNFKSMGNPKQLFLVAKVMAVFILMGNSNECFLNTKAMKSVQNFVIVCNPKQMLPNHKSNENGILRGITSLC